MATQADVRRIALSLPATHEDRDRFAFSVDSKPKPKGIAWVWLERVDPNKPRVPNPAVLGVRVRDNDEKATLLAADPDKFFTEPHYNGFPAILVRLANVTSADLEKLLADAWRCQAPRALVKAYDAADATIAAPSRAPKPRASKPRASTPRKPRSSSARVRTTSRARRGRSASPKPTRK